MMGSSERSILRIVIAPDSFKGSLAAEDVADAIFTVVYSRIGF